MGKSRKGGQFERELCKELSLWWTKGENDAVFWRTSNSGARATVRGKVGKRTKGQEGDVCATDPVGAPLTRLITIEAKRGYNKDCHLGDLLDLSPSKKLTERPLEEFLVQAARQGEAAQTPYWLLVVRRDQRSAVVYMLRGLSLDLRDAGSSLLLSEPRAEIVTGPTRGVRARIFATTLDEFFRRVKPKHVEALVRERC